MRTNKSEIFTVVGNLGSGKSFASLKIASMISPDFGIDNVVFSVKDFFKVFTRLREERDDEGRGSVIIFEESEKDLNSRRSMSDRNTLFGEISSTLRFSQISVGFNLPSLGMLDLNQRRVNNHIFSTIDIDRESCPPVYATRTGVRMYRVVQSTMPSKDDQNIRYMFPVVEVPVTNRSGQQFIRKCKVGSIWLQKPDEFLLREYAKRKTAFFNGILSDATAKLAYRERQERGKMASVGIEAIPSRKGENPVPSSIRSAHTAEETTALSSLLRSQVNRSI